MYKVFLTLCFCVWYINNWAQPAQLNEWSHLGTQHLEVLYLHDVISNNDIKAHIYTGAGNYIASHDFSTTITNSVSPTHSIVCKIVTELGLASGAILLTDADETVVWQALSYGTGAVTIVDGPPIGVGTTTTPIGTSEVSDPGDNQSVQDLTDIGTIDFIVQTSNCGDLNTGQALPVELISFNVQLSDDGFAKLTWTTASEINSAYADIEHARDGNQFEKVGTVPLAGNSLVYNYYEFIFQNLEQGDNYFRLRLVDLDGKFEYSQVISLQENQINKPYDLLTFPNSHYRIVFNEKVFPFISKVSLVNIVGQSVGKIRVTVYGYEIAIPKTAGIYFIRFYQENLHKFYNIKVLSL